MLFRKLLPVLIGITMLLTLVTGCGSNSAASNESPGSSTQSAGLTGNSSSPVKITYYGGWTGPDLDRMKALVDKFNSEQNKIQVDFTSLQWTQMFAKFLTDFKAGTPADVLAMHTFEIGQFADMGVLDSDAIAGLKLNGDDYMEKAWKNSSYKGVQYAVPIGFNMHTLYYNKDLFAKQGITVAPKTGEELISVGQKLTLDKNGKHPNEAGFDENNIVQYGLGFSMNHHIFYQFYALLNQQDANTITEDMTELKFDEQKAADAFSFIQNEIYKYKMVPVGEKSPIDDFKAGKVAMIIDGCWQIAGLESSNVNWDTAEYPKIFNNSKVWGSAEVVALPQNKDDAKKAAAAEFVKWLSNNSASWGESGQLPALKSAFETIKDLKGRQALINDLDDVTFIPAHPLATQIFSSTAPSPILTAAQDTVLNKKETKDVVKKLIQDMNAILSQK